MRNKIIIISLIAMVLTTISTQAFAGVCSKSIVNIAVDISHLTLDPNDELEQHTCIRNNGKMETFVSKMTCEAGCID